MSRSAKVALTSTSLSKLFGATFDGRSRCRLAMMCVYLFILLTVQLLTCSLESPRLYFLDIITALINCCVLRMALVFFLFSYQAGVLSSAWNITRLNSCHLLTIRFLTCSLETLRFNLSTIVYSWHRCSVFSYHSCVLTWARDTSTVLNSGNPCKLPDRSP